MGQACPGRHEDNGSDPGVRPRFPTHFRRFYRPPRRESASPNRSSSTPMRSMIDKYRLHSLRLSSPEYRTSTARPVLSVPPSPPASTTGSFMLSCFHPAHMFDSHSRQL